MTKKLFLRDESKDESKNEYTEYKKVTMKELENGISCPCILSTDGWYKPVRKLSADDVLRKSLKDNKTKVYMI